METGEFNCKICGENTSGFPALHRHLKKEHGSAPFEYYPLFYDRRDWYDGDLIPFKDIKSYFATHFNSKYNLLKWVEAGGPKVNDYILDLLVKRAADKGTTKIPSHVELKSLFAPNLTEYISAFGGIDKLTEAVEAKGLTLKLKTTKPALREGEMSIFIDTREQHPLSFSFKSETKKSIVGDYFPNNEFFCNLFVERKSIHDLAGTLTKGLERFEREIQRAGELGAYLVVITESPFLDALEYSPKNSFSQRIGGSYLFNKVRRLMTDYDNVQFVFAKNRLKSTSMIESIFRMGEAAKTTDLEFLKDKGDL